MGEDTINELKKIKLFFEMIEQKLYNPVIMRGDGYFTASSWSMTLVALFNDMSKSDTNNCCPLRNHINSYFISVGEPDKYSNEYLRPHGINETRFLSMYDKWYPYHKMLSLTKLSEREINLIVRIFIEKYNVIKKSALFVFDKQDILKINYLDMYLSGNANYGQYIVFYFPSNITEVLNRPKYDYLDTEPIIRSFMDDREHAYYQFYNNHPSPEDRKRRDDEFERRKEISIEDFYNYFKNVDDLYDSNQDILNKTLKI
jgi:hypothetical protein